MHLSSEGGMSFHIPDDVYQALCKSVGDLVLNWGLAESALDIGVAIVFHRGGNAVENTIPKAMDKKTEFLKQCFKTLLQLSPWREEATALAIEANNLANVRHTVVHGSISQYDPNGHKIVFHMLKAEPTIHRHRTQTLAIESILAAGSKSAALCGKLLNLDERLAKALVAQDIFEDAARHSMS
jgi:hypothetical protein